MRTRRKILAVMALSGAVAGIGGASQDGDFRHTLDPRGLTTAGYGYAGIVIAALAGTTRSRSAWSRSCSVGFRTPATRCRAADFPSGLVGVMQGADSLLRARGRAACPLSDSLRAPPARRGGNRVILAAGGVNNSVLVVVLASAVIYGTPLLFRRTRRAPHRALRRAQPRRRGDDARRRGDGFLGRPAHRVAVTRDSRGGDRRRCDGGDPRVPRDHAASEPDRLRLGPDDLRRGRRSSRRISATT